MDIVNFEMTAFDQKVNINTFDKEMREAYNASSEVLPKRVLELFPELEPNRSEILKRTPIHFTKQKKYAETLYSSDQMYSFGDEALGQVFVSMPARLTGDIVVDSQSGKFSILLRDKLELQIDKLAEQGFNRSAFQLVKRFDLHKNYFITVLNDSISPGKITNLIVYLDKNHLRELDLNRINFLQEMSSQDPEHIKQKTISLFNLDGGDCYDDIFNGKWYVYRRRGDVSEGGSICNIKQFDCNMPGNDWEILATKDTKEEAIQWRRQSNLCANKGDDTL